MLLERLKAIFSIYHDCVLAVLFSEGHTTYAPKAHPESEERYNVPLNYLPKYRATTVNKNGSTAQCQRPKIRHWFFLENAIHNGNHAIPMLELVSCSNGQV